MKRKKTLPLPASYTGEDEDGENETTETLNHIESTLDSCMNQSESSMIDAKPKVKTKNTETADSGSTTGGTEVLANHVSSTPPSTVQVENSVVTTGQDPQPIQTLVEEEKNVVLISSSPVCDPKGDADDVETRDQMLFSTKVNHSFIGGGVEDSEKTSPCPSSTNDVVDVVIDTAPPGSPQPPPTLLKAELHPVTASSPVQCPSPQPSTSPSLNHDRIQDDETRSTSPPTAKVKCKVQDDFSTGKITNFLLTVIKFYFIYY